MRHCRRCGRQRNWPMFLWFEWRGTRIATKDKACSFARFAMDAEPVSLRILRHAGRTRAQNVHTSIWVCSNSAIAAARCSPGGVVHISTCRSTWTTRATATLSSMSSKRLTASVGHRSIVTMDPSASTRVACSKPRYHGVAGHGRIKARLNCDPAGLYLPKQAPSAYFPPLNTLRRHEPRN